MIVSKILWAGNETAGFIAYPSGVWPVGEVSPLGYDKTNRFDAIGDLVERIERSDRWKLSEWVSLIEAKSVK